MNTRLFGFAAIVLTASSLQANTITGDLEMGGLIVNVNPVTNLISFLPGLVPIGNFVVAPGSNGDFSPLIGTDGNVRPFNGVPGPQSISPWIVNIPGLTFTLTAVKPGNFSSTGCTTGVPSAGQTCTPAGGVGDWINTSPTTSTTSITVLGTVDNGSGLSNFTAIFNATFGESFQTIFTGAAPISASTGSGSLVATATPEPGAPILCSIGLIGIVLYRFRISGHNQRR